MDDAEMSENSFVIELREDYERYGPLWTGDGLVRIDSTD